ncbi:hypothetical protein KCU95_g126, partial [Aureobasidium melanogenum]
LTRHTDTSQLPLLPTTFPLSSCKACVAIRCLLSSVCRQERKSVRARVILNDDISIQFISHDAGQSLKYAASLPKESRWTSLLVSSPLKLFPRCSLPERTLFLLQKRREKYYSASPSYPLHHQIHGQFSWLLGIGLVDENVEMVFLTPLLIAIPRVPRSPQSGRRQNVDASREESFMIDAERQVDNEDRYLYLLNGAIRYRDVQLDVVSTQPMSYTPFQKRQWGQKIVQ